MTEGGRVTLTLKRRAPRFMIPGEVLREPSTGRYESPPACARCIITMPPQGYGPDVGLPCSSVATSKPPRPATVVQYVGVRRAHFRPVILIMRIVVISAALGEIHFHLRMCCLHLAHHAGHALRNRARRLNSHISESRDYRARTSPCPRKQVVIENPYFRGGPCLLEQRSYMIGDELCLRTPVTTCMPASGHADVIDLVLRRNRLDGHALCGISP